jgi:hypothetical protein
MKFRSVFYRSTRNREWQWRRLVITKEKISFSFEGEDLEIDYIPLSDVDYVCEMKDSGESSSLNMSQEGESSLPTLQIATTRDGHNSGRAYYIQTETHEGLADLEAVIQRTVKAAKQREEARNLFRLWQNRVLKVYQAGLMQAFIALTIIAVGIALLAPLPCTTFGRTTCFLLPGRRVLR